MAPSLIGVSDELLIVRLALPDPRIHVPNRSSMTLGQ